jgi:hypothetical protein
MLPSATGTFAAALGKIGHLASGAWNLFAPKPLYAIDTRTGLSGGFSPFGAVVTQLFFEDWTGYTPPTSLTSLTQPFNARDAGGGTWTGFATSPGSIIVQASFDGISSNVAVLSQGGGACDTKTGNNCGGLSLKGVLNATPANGIYKVEWTAVEGSPTVKAAPFKILSSTNQEIAVLAYITTSSTNQFTLKTACGTETLGTWVRNVAQRFVFTVNLTTTPRSVSLTVSPLSNAAGAPATFSFTTCSNSNIPANMKSVMADFTGIDAGTVGWEDIKVYRVPDPLPQSQ